MNNDECKYYLGLAETTFKERYTNHESSLNNENSKNSTELLKYVCSLKENNKMPSIKWNIVKIVYSKATSSMFNRKAVYFEWLGGWQMS